MKECKYCYQENADDAVTCSNCGARFDHTLPIINQENYSEIESINKNTLNKKKVNLQIVERITGKEILITEKGTIGKLGFGKDLLQKDVYVGNHQCLVEYKDSQWYIRHNGKNPTRLNGLALERDVETIIREGDQLELADLLFSVHLISNEVAIEKQEEIEDQKPIKNSPKKYFVVCRHCHTKYNFENESSKPSLCTVCIDPMDKKDLAIEKIHEE